MKKRKKLKIAFLFAFLITVVLTEPCFAPNLWCSCIYCKDMTGDFGVTIIDFITVIGEFGETGEDRDPRATICCPDGLDGIFSDNGQFDSDDVSGWDWTLRSERRKNLCKTDVPLTDDPDKSGGMAKSSVILPGPIEFDGALLVAGKIYDPCEESSLDRFLNDGLYGLDRNGQYSERFDPVYELTNGKLVRDSADVLYQTNWDNGLVRFSDGATVIPSGSLSVDNEPRYNGDGQVHIGLHQDGSEDWWGRPIMDAAFDSEGYVYVVPVVVEPEDPNAEPYKAAAKIELDPNETPPYTLVKLYDDTDAADPNVSANLKGLKEIEIDSDNNLYIFNTYYGNNILWIYNANTGEMVNRFEFANDPNLGNYVPGPTGMYVSNTTRTVYLAPTLNGAEATSTLLYGFSTEGDLALERSITINGMGHATGITEDPTTGTLWVVGFRMQDIPEYPTANDPPFWEPYIAEIQTDSNEVEAVSLSDPNSGPGNDLALPLSIIWTGPTHKCGYADLDESGDVGLSDLCEVALRWLDPNCATSDDCDGADIDLNGLVNYEDWSLFFDCWLWPASGDGQDPNQPEPADPNVTFSIVDANGLSEITIDVNDSITLYVDMETREEDVYVFHLEVNISDPNLGSIDNTPYDPNNPPGSGTARILADPRTSFFDYWGPGINQEEGIELIGAASLSSDLSDGHLASFVFTCESEGDVTLELTNWASWTTAELKTITIHQN